MPKSVFSTLFLISILVAMEVEAGAADESVFLTKCEEMVGERLRAPSSYRLAEVLDFRIRDASLEERMAWNYRQNEGQAYEQWRNVEIDEDTVIPGVAENVQPLNRALLLDQRKDAEAFEFGKFKYALLRFSYDAANVFNAPLRRTSTCTTVFESRSNLKDTLDAGEFMVFLDGKTSLEWALDSLDQQ